MEFDLIPHTIFLALMGSHAYGLNTPESDEDYKGVLIPPPDFIYGFNKHFEQFETKVPNDTAIFNITKFFSLATSCNPTIIEMLFVDDAFVKRTSDYWERVKEVRDKFLSTKAAFSFSGYAFSQLARIKTHRQYLLNPPTKEPSKDDFKLNDIQGKIIPNEQLGAANKVIDDLIEEWLVTDEKFPKGVKEKVIENVGLLLRRCWETLMNTECHVNTNEILWKTAAHHLGYESNFIEYMSREKAYKNAVKSWKSYQNWKNTRNPKRAILEEKFGYDCYSNDTEFLTLDGWKSFYSIGEKDKLATVFLSPTGKDLTQRKHLGVEYQNYTEKFEGTFTGNMYNLFGYHTDVLVTPNHRILYQYKEKNTKKTYEWELGEIATLPNCVNILRNISPNRKNYTDNHFFSEFPLTPTMYLKLMGWYLSDGTCTFKKNKEGIKPGEIRISQKKYGKLYHKMITCQRHNKSLFRIYNYERKVNIFNSKHIIETILSTSNTKIVNKIVEDCSFLKNKRIPRWVFSLSRWKMETLLDAMMGGDGTESRPDNSLIYYSSSKQLADDFQELAFLCGFETSLYGPYIETKQNYTINMYHVHVNKTRNQVKEITRTQNIAKNYVENQKIVCFTVPNGTLITRRNGHIGIHGNSKHSSHLVRLLLMGEEVLSKGEVNVFRKDAEILKGIREGAWKFEELLEWANKQQKKIYEIYDNGTSPLPKSPDENYLNQVCIELQTRFISEFIK